MLCFSSPLSAQEWYLGAWMSLKSEFRGGAKWSDWVVKPCLLFSWIYALPPGFRVDYVAAYGSYGLMGCMPGEHSISLCCHCVWSYRCPFPVKLGPACESYIQSLDAHSQNHGTLLFIHSPSNCTLQQLSLSRCKGSLCIQSCWAHLLTRACIMDAQK